MKNMYKRLNHNYEVINIDKGIWSVQRKYKLTYVNPPTYVKI